MSSLSPAHPAIVWCRRHATVYHATIVVVLGLATAGFLTLIAVLIMVAANFNLLGLIE